MTKVHKITLCVIDHDELGGDAVGKVLETARYPNHCIRPNAMAVETAEVEWHDKHPLNYQTTQREAFDKLFPDAPTDVTPWKSCGISHNDITLFKLEDQPATVRIPLTRNKADAWLLVHEDDEVIRFACFEFFMSNADGSDVQCSMLFHGSGISGSLRECRHIWWGGPGDSGYTYSLNFDVVAEALNELRTWFDG